MLVYAESQVAKLIAVKLFLRNSNACDRNPPTSLTDGQTDRLIVAIPLYAKLRAVKKPYAGNRMVSVSMPLSDP